MQGDTLQKSLFSYVQKGTAAIAWFPLLPNPRKKWELRLWDVLIDEATVGVCTPQLPCTAVIDTGTSGIGGSPAFIEQILDRTGALSLCSEAEKENLKRLSFVLEPPPGDEPQAFTIDPKDYTTNASSSLDCTSTFMALPLPAGQSHTIVSQLSECLCLVDTYTLKYLPTFCTMHTHSAGGLDITKDAFRCWEMLF